MLRRPDLLQPPGETARIRLKATGDFEFESARKIAHPRNDVVHGRLFQVEKDWARQPLVVLVHGWNAELHYLYILPRLARSLNRAGFNAALIELPFHMHRRPLEENGMRDFISDDLPGMLNATRQAISDIDSLCRWGLAQGCRSTAVWGFSLGAWLTGLYICESKLPSAAVLTTPVSDLATGISELAFCHPIRSSLNGTKLDFARLNLTENRPKLMPESIQVVQSEYDLFVPEKSYKELARAWNLCGWVREPHGHISVLTSRSAMMRSIRWLGERI